MLSLSFTFAILIMICLGVGLYGFILFGILCVSYTCITVSFFMFGKFSAIISSNTFLISSLSLLLLESLLCIGWHVFYYPIGHLRCFKFFFICLTVCCSDWVISIILSSRWLTHSSVSLSWLFIASRLVFISAVELSIFFNIFIGV